MNDDNRSTLEEVQIISVKETCNIIGVSVATIYRWSDEGKLPFPKIQIGPKKVGFRKVDVKNFILNQIEEI